jgi:hypothetical protein
VGSVGSAGGSKKVLKPQMNADNTGATRSGVPYRFLSACIGVHLRFQFSSADPFHTATKKSG